VPTSNCARVWKSCNAQIQNGDANGAAISIKKSEDAGGNGVSFNSIHILLSQGNFPVALQKYKELAHTERDPLLIAMALAGGAHVANGMDVSQKLSN